MIYQNGKKEWMQLQWNKRSCPYLKTLVRQVQTQEQTQQLRLPEELPDMGRVLCAWGQSIIRSKEQRGDTILVSGGVSGVVAYLPEDGSFARSVEVWIPFQVKWTSQQTQRECPIRCTSLLRSMDARILSARKIMVRANISVLAEALEPTETEVTTPAEQAEVQILKKTYPAVLPREAGEKVLAFEEEITLANVKKWISWQIHPALTEQTVLRGRLVMRGVGQLHYVYQDESGQIGSGWQDIPFAHFAELEKEYDKEATADVMMAVAGLETEPTEGGIRVQGSFMAQYVIWERELLEVAEDAYCPNGEVQFSVQPLMLPMELDDRYQTLIARPQFHEGKILDVSFFPSHPDQYREENEIHVSLNGLFQILYEDMDGNLQTVTENWDQEFAVSAASDSQVATTLKQITGQEQGLGFELKLGLHTQADQQIPMITELEMGQMRQPDADRPTLVLRRMDRETLWEIAKQTGSTMEAITQANGLTQEPEQGQMLLIPIP